MIIGVVASAALITGLGVGFAEWREPGKPHVDPHLQTELTPVIQRHLETRVDHGGALTSAAKPEGRWFCDLRMVETRRRGPDVLAGIYAHCEELARRGQGMVTGTSFMAPMLITLRSGAVTKVEKPMDGAGYGPGIDRMFTEEGEHAVFEMTGSGFSDEETLRARAKRMYGLPPAAPVANDF